MPMAGSSHCGSAAWRTSAPTWRAVPARCRRTSTCICRAASTRFPAIALHVVTVLSNTTPIGVTRGPGFAEAVNVIERLIDAAARQCGFDRAELRRRNMVPADGDADDQRARVSRWTAVISLRPSIARSHWRMSPASRHGARKRSARIAARPGLAYHIKGTGGSPHENVDIRFESDGTVSLITGTQTIGQGHETTFPQILADRLGVPNELIRLRQGDTDLIPIGGGHGSSRATYMGGTAIWRASETIVAEGPRDRRRCTGGGGGGSSSSSMATSQSSAPIARYRCWMWRRGLARPARHSTPITHGRAST